MAYNNQIEKFDPSKLMDGVRDRIKATFVSLIPDEAWEQMLEKEIYIFTTGRILPHHEYKGTGSDGRSEYFDWEERIPYSQVPQKDQWGNPNGPDDISPLQKMIRDALRKKFHDDLVNYLNSDCYIATRDQYGITQMSTAVEDIMVKHAGDLFRSIIGDFMQRGIERLRADVASTGMQY